MKKFLLGTAAAVSAAFAVGAPAEAALVLSTAVCSSGPCINTYGTLGIPGGYETTLQVRATGAFQGSPVTNTPFSDLYTFGTGTGVLQLSIDTTSTSPGSEDDIDFTLVRLDGPSGPVVISTGGEPDEFGSVLLNVQAGTYQLLVEGDAGGVTPVFTSYGGNITFTPVPEPATWAMMLAGFGAIGYSIRRRKSYRLLQAV